MKKKLEELMAKLKGLKDRIEADDKDAIAEAEKLKGEIETTKAAIAEAEKKAELLKLIGNTGKEGGDDPADKPAKSLGENFVAHLKTAQPGKRFNVSAPAFEKAPTDTQTSVSGELGKDFILSEGDHGYMQVHPDLKFSFDPNRDYLYPVPIDDRTLNPNLTQNPGWNDGLDY